MDSSLLDLLLLTTSDNNTEDDDKLLLILAATIVHASNDDHHRSIQQHRVRCGYLSRPQLLPNPLSDTPWTVLYRSCSDSAYLATMGLDVTAFQAILDAQFSLRWYLTPLHRSDATPATNPRCITRSLNAGGALGLLLHWLTSTMRQISLQQIFALIPSTMSRYITTSLPLLIETLRSMDSARICWPQGDEFHELSQLVSARHPLLSGVFGSIDGLNIACQVLADVEIENATYNGWLHGHYISSVIAFSSRGMSTGLVNQLLGLMIQSPGEIISARTNCPGSWHDSRIAVGIYKQLDTETPEGFCLVADSAFPQGSWRLVGKILVPLQNGDPLLLDGDEHRFVLAQSCAVLSYRQTAEWDMRQLQGSFGQLSLLLDINDWDQRSNLLEVCFQLHNLKARLIGINQICNIYSRAVRQPWGGFESILFPRRQVSRVSNFHVQEEWS